MPKAKPSPWERFLAHIDAWDALACWPWKGSLMPNDYGNFYWDGKAGYAHRYAYEACIGPIPKGLTIDHLCHNRPCVNPIHLEPVTNKVNILRGEGASAKHAVKTHCVNGHLLDRIVYRKTPGRSPVSRYCSICDSINNARSYAKRKKKK